MGMSLGLTPAYGTYAGVNIFFKSMIQVNLYKVVEILQANDKVGYNWNKDVLPITNISNVGRTRASPILFYLA